MKKFNIAYLPKNKSNEFVNIAQQFKGYSAGYVLGEQSLPHVTIRHFLADEAQLDSIWTEIKKHMPVEPVTLKFASFSCLPFKNFHWASLMPDQREYLFMMHEKTSQILESEPRSDYDPHLTLFNTHKPEYKQAVESYAKHYQVIEDEFYLALGTRGRSGQFVEVLKRM